MRRQVKYTIAAEDHTGRALQSVKANLGGVDSALRGMSTRLLGVLGIGGGLAATVASFNQFANELDNLGKQARVLGQTAAELDNWYYAAERMGVSAQTFDQILARLPAVIQAAMRGSGQAADAFKNLGVEITDQAGRIRPYTQVLLEMADALEKLPTAEARAAALAGAFPEKYKDLVRVLGQGGEAIRELLVDAAMLGERTDDLTEKAERYKDRQADLNRSLRTFRDTVYQFALPALTDLAKTMSNDISRGFRNVSEDYQRMVFSFREDPKTGLEKIDREIGAVGAALEEAMEKLREQESAWGRLRRQVGLGVKLPKEITELRDRLRLLNQEYEELQRRVEKSPVVPDDAADDVDKLGTATKDLDRILAAYGPKIEVLYGHLKVLGEAHRSGAVDTETYAATVSAIYDAMRKLDPEMVAQDGRARRASQIMRELETESERYARRLEEIAELHERGYLTTEEYSLALQRLATSTETVGDRGETAMRKWGDAAETAGRGVAEAVSGAVAVSTQELDGLEAHAANVLNRIMSMWMETGLAGPLADWLRAAFGGGGGDTPPAAGMPGGPEGPPSPGTAAAQAGATNVSLTIQALDTRSGVEFLMQNRQAIVAVVQDSLHRGGNSVVMR